VNIEDSTKLLYANAFTMEAERMFPIVPLSLIHSNTEDTTLSGYFIPKRSYIIPNIYALQNSPKYWENPEIFQPERFLNWDPTDIRFSPFGAGQRQCAGMRIARLNVLQILCTLLQRYEFRTSDNEFIFPIMNFGLTISPQPFNILVKLRNE